MNVGPTFVRSRVGPVCAGCAVTAFAIFSLEIVAVEGGSANCSPLPEAATACFHKGAFVAAQVCTPVCESSPPVPRDWGSCRATARPKPPRAHPLALCRKPLLGL